MQPKLLWGGVAVVGLGLVVGLFAVYYAAQHPGSLMAQMSVALVSGDLHNNPLCDGQCILKTKTVEETPSWMESTSVPPRVFGRVASSSDQLTIEPIQIEPLPPPTIEPPAFEASEWRPLSRSALPVFIDETPVRMPFADETLRHSSSIELFFPVFEAVRSLAMTSFGNFIQLPDPAVQEDQRQDYPGQQLIDPPAGCGHGSSLSWDLRNELDPSKCESWCPLAQALRVMCLPWLGWFNEKPTGQEEQREPPIVDDPGVQLIDPPVRGWWRKMGWR